MIQTFQAISPNKISTVQTDPLETHANAFITTMAEINKLWDEKSTARREAVNELIESGYKIHISFYEYMYCVSNQFNKSYKILEAIKSEMKIAEAEGVFDKDNIVEVKENAKKLLDTVLLGREHNPIIRSNIFEHKLKIMTRNNTNHLNHHKKVIQDVYSPTFQPNAICHNKEEDIEDADFQVISAEHCINREFFPAEHTNIKDAAQGNWIIAKIKGAASFGPSSSAVGDGTTRLSDCRKSKKTLEDRISDLDILCNEMDTLQHKSEDFIRATTNLISNLEFFFESIESNTKSCLTRDSEVKGQASKMDEQAAKLQSCFKNIEVQAAKDASKLRRLVLLNNPEALLSK